MVSKGSAIVKFGMLPNPEMQKSMKEVALMKGGTLYVLQL